MGLTQADTTALKADDTATARPMPPWPYAAAPGHGGFPGIAWFGANESGAENRAQMDVTFANYSMIVFGWQDWLRGTDFNGELDTMVEQAQAVKLLNNFLSATAMAATSTPAK